MSKAKTDERCYFCKGAVTSKEHIPPKSFFPTEKRKNLITVPSCDEHNGKKSKDDEYIKNLFANASEQIGNDASLNPLLQSSHRALFERKRGLAFLNQAKIVREASGGEVVYAKVDIERICNFFHCLSRGLLFHHKKIRFDGMPKISIHFLEKSNQDKNLLDLFNEVKIHGENRDIFYYKCTSPVDTYGYIISICFYKEFKVSVEF